MKRLCRVCSVEFFSAPPVAYCSRKCYQSYWRQWRAKNKERINARARERWRDEPDHREARRAIARRCYKKRRAKAGHVVRDYKKRDA